MACPPIQSLYPNMSGPDSDHVASEDPDIAMLLENEDTRQDAIIRLGEIVDSCHTKGHIGSS